jgi:iron(III) transport system substrate-binding protein
MTNAPIPTDESTPTTATDEDASSSGPRHGGRRRFLAAAGGLGAAALAGCTDLLGGGGDDSAPFDWLGSGPGQRLGQDGTPMADMPTLEGELTVYSGRHEFLVGDLVDSIESRYDDFSLDVRYGGSRELVNQIVTEGSGTPADVFYSVNAGSLGALADGDRTTELSSDLRSLVPDAFSTPDWIGTSGRARSIPYNTEAFSESALPTDVLAYPTDVDADFGWAPGYGSCQAFVTAMRILEGDERTREWLEALLDAGVQRYPNEFRVCEAVADGEIDVGFTNHYYVQRVLDNRPSAPIATHFTTGDAGAIFNVAGAAVTDQAGDVTLAENFVRHLLSAEAQAYFAVQTFEYPLAPDVDPVGDLPSIDELQVPEIDLARLSEVGETIDLMEAAGVEV